MTSLLQVVRPGAAKLLPPGTDLILAARRWAGPTRRIAARALAWFTRGLVVVALCALACTFALDWGRIFFVAAPVFYGASAWVLRDRRRLHVPVLAAWAVLILVYAVYMQVHGVQHGIIEVGPPAYPVQ